MSFEMLLMANMVHLKRSIFKLGDREREREIYIERGRESYRIERGKVESKQA